MAPIVGSRFLDWAPWNGWDPSLTDPLQWICREWVQGLGFDETTVNARVGDDRVGVKNTEVDGLMIRGKWAPRPRVWIPIWSDSPGARRRNLCPFPPREQKPPLLLGEISYLIYFLSAHPSPTLVSHRYPHLSARLISHSFWRCVSCCDPNHTVQGSRPYKLGQDVSFGYLIRRWQPLLELLLYHASMAGLLRSGFSLGCSRRLPLAAWLFPLTWFWSVENRVILDSISWQSEFSLFVLGHFFLLSMDHESNIKWARVPRSFGPTLLKYLKHRDFYFLFFAWSCKKIGNQHWWFFFFFLHVVAKKIGNQRWWNFFFWLEVAKKKKETNVDGFIYLFIFAWSCKKIGNQL